MSGHKHNPSAATQNQGNSIGDRSSVRQSMLYRKHESGNDVKSILGTTNLCWDQNHQEGAYAGREVFDHTKPNPFSSQNPKNRGNELKDYVNSSYNKSTQGNVTQDYSRESDSYSQASRGYGNNIQQPVSLRNAYRDSTDEGQTIVRGNSFKNNSSSMGGQSLAQFQASSAAYNPPPPQAHKYGRNNSSNSNGISSIMSHDEGTPNVYQQQHQSKNKAYEPPRGYGYSESQSYGGGQNQPPQYRNQEYQYEGNQDDDGRGNREGRSTRPW